MTAPTGTRPDEAHDRAGLSGGLLTGVFLAVVAAGMLVTWLMSDRAPATATEGEPAPPFEVPTFAGDRFDLEEHLRQDASPVLLNLWASWCEPCLREFPLLSEYAARTPEVTVVGVAVQDREEAARAFAEEMQPRFPVGWDEDGSLREAYPSFGLPATFVITSDGTIAEIILAELTGERLDAIDFD